MHLTPCDNINLTLSLQATDFYSSLTARLLAVVTYRPAVIQLDHMIRCLMYSLDRVILWKTLLI